MCVAITPSVLKTLFNIVEAPFWKMVEHCYLCCMMMFRWTIKQPGIQKFWNLCGLYQDIYDWISPLNKRSGRPFILIHSSLWAEMSMVFLVTGRYWGAIILGLHFYTLSKTLIAIQFNSIQFNSIQLEFISINNKGIKYFTKYTFT